MAEPGRSDKHLDLVDRHGIGTMLAEVQDGSGASVDTMIDRAIGSIMSGPALDPIDWAIGPAMFPRGLDPAMRELVLIASCVTMGHALPQLRTHAEAALRAGARPEQIVQTVLQLTFYAGGPAVRNSLALLKELFDGCRPQAAAA